MHKAAIIYCTSPTELVSQPDSNQEASGCNTAEDYGQFDLECIEAKKSIFECKSCLIVCDKSWIAVCCFKSRCHYCITIRNLAKNTF